MQAWVTAILFATVLTVVPFMSVLRLLAQLPRPLALSHARWPQWANALAMAVVVGVVAVFIRTSYLGSPQPAGRIAIAFVIAALVYAFGLSLLMRQFCGVYPDYVITVAAPGLIVRKTSYSTIENVEPAGEGPGEVRFRIVTARGAVLLTLPAQHASTLYAQVRRKLNSE
jgi:hypothetical protein